MEVSSRHPFTCAQPVIGILFYPKQLKAEMGNGYSGCMMMGYPKQPWAEMGKGGAKGRSQFPGRLVDLVEDLVPGGV